MASLYLDTQTGMSKKTFIQRDISWLSFNARVLQEANDPSVPLLQRIRFLGIFSNNLDEFFRVRVATLKRMMEYTQQGKKLDMHLEDNPEKILNEIQLSVLRHQEEFERIWHGIINELHEHKVFLVDETHLTKEQQHFVEHFFDEQVRGNVIPMMIEHLPQLPYLREKSLFLGVVMRKELADLSIQQQYALIEVPVSAVGRFVQLPSKPGEHNIILLEDVIRFNLHRIFSYFGYTEYKAHIFKITKDAELDLDSDIATPLVQKLQKSLKNRRKGKPVRFVYDKDMDTGLVEYLIRKINFSSKGDIIPSSRIHNFRHFIDFPDVLTHKAVRMQPFRHPELMAVDRVTEVILKKDVMLHFPYHSFNAVIDLLREAAMDPDVISIKLTAYRLAPASKVINALINAARNGKQVTVMLELKARFDEEANLEWKDRLEDEGVKVLIGLPQMKVHAKVCVIRKRMKNKIVQFGFISTGNLNEKTARIYADHCLLTANRNIMADINRVFRFLEMPKPDLNVLRQCKTLLVSPVTMRSGIVSQLDKEIRQAKAKKPAALILKSNSLSDAGLIRKLYDAARVGVELQMVIRGIFCALPHNKHFKKDFRAISIIDEYLEHARIMIFGTGTKQNMYISSADWMVRNLDHRVEVAVRITDKKICNELRDIMAIQLADNVKARILNNTLSNNYVSSSGKKIRSQKEIYLYLHNKVAKQE
jgi:polyphosphate kinase